MEKKGIKHNYESALVQIYLLSRYVVLVCKKYSKDSQLVPIFVTMYLLSEKPRTVRELASLFSVNHSFMSSFISDLEKKGYVQKKRHKDHRFRSIELTPKGKKTAKVINELGQTHAENLFQNMTEKEMKVLEEVFHKFNRKYDLRKDLAKIMEKGMPF